MKTYTLPAALLIALAKVAPAMSTDETRFILNGARISGDGEIVATDGKRIHVAKVAGMPADMPEIIIQAHGVKALAKLAKKTAENFTLEVPERNKTAYATFPDGTVVQVPVVDGNFPRYRQVIPSAEAHHIFTKLPAKSHRLFRDIAKEARANYKARMARWKTKAAAAQPGITSKAQGEAWKEANPQPLGSEAGNGALFTDGKVMCGGIIRDFPGFMPCAHSFNPEYLEDAIQAAGDGAETVGRDDMSPLTVTGKDFLAIVMPQRFDAVAEVIARENRIAEEVRQFTAGESVAA